MLAYSDARLFKGDPEESHDFPAILRIALVTLAQV
jgi:hypothetical protein